MNIVKCIMYLKSKGYTYIYDNTFFDSKGRKITFDNFYELEKFVLTLMDKDVIVYTTKHQEVQNNEKDYNDRVFL